MSDPMETPVLSSRVVAERTQVLIPSLPNWIEPTVDYLCQKAVLSGACHEGRSGKLMIALHEAIANAVIHGNLEIGSELKEQGDSAFAETLAHRSTIPALTSRKVEIVVDFDGDVCRWIITDEGKGFDIEATLARCLSDDPEILLASGRGILMMKSLLDGVHYERGGRRVILTLARHSGAEKRKDDRVPVMAPFKVTPMLPDGQPNWAGSYEVMSRNLSEHGIGILQEQLSHSQQILIGIPTTHGIVNIPAEVKHSRPFGSTGVELGCQFLHAVQAEHAQSGAADDPQLREVQEAVTSFLEKYQAKQLPGHERRVHPRIVFNERVTIYLGDRPEPIIGYARDLSKGGIALIAQEPVPGEITIAFAPGPDRQRLKVRCRVKRCDCIKEGFYDIAATFTRLVGRP